MGCRPGDWDESTFMLPNHENLTNTQIVDKICDHFSEISQEYPPLNIDLLPRRVQCKIKNPICESPVPNLMEYEVYSQLKAPSKPTSGVPGDLPRCLIVEFYFYV